MVSWRGPAEDNGAPVTMATLWRVKLKYVTETQLGHLPEDAFEALHETADVYGALGGHLALSPGGGGGAGGAKPPGGGDIGSGSFLHRISSNEFCTNLTAEAVFGYAVSHCNEMGRGPRSSVASWRPPDHVRALHAANARAAANRPTRSTALWDEYVRYPGHRRCWMTGLH